MYSSLDDIYTRYFTPDQAQEINALLTTSEGGALIGITMELYNDTIRIIRVIPSSPAALAGLQKGDLILKVNNIPVNGAQALENYALQTQGGAGTPIHLTVLQGAEMKEFSMTKEEIMLPTVYLDSVETVPVLQITQFTGTTTSAEGTLGEFRDALKEIAGAKSAVLDVRGNPGGSVDQCIAIADELIPTGVIIRTIAHELDEKKNLPIIDTVDYFATTGGMGESVAWVLMADRNSASCAEILVWALRTYKPFPIIGDTTYGKGVGQIYTYTYLEGMAGITSLQFFNQQMETYNKIGIAPTEVIVNGQDALAQAVQLALTQRGLAKRNAVLLPQQTLQSLNARMASRQVVKPATVGGAWKWHKDIEFPF